METEDGNEDVCGACTEVGDLICCESCPAAYHAECAGYVNPQEVPAGDWYCWSCCIQRKRSFPFPTLRFRQDPGSTVFVGIEGRLDSFYRATLEYLAPDNCTVLFDETEGEVTLHKREQLGRRNHRLWHGTADPKAWEKGTAPFEWHPLSRRYAVAHSLKADAPVTSQSASQATSQAPAAAPAPAKRQRHRSSSSGSLPTTAQPVRPPSAPLSRPASVSFMAPGTLPATSAAAAGQPPAVMPRSILVGTLGHHVPAMPWFPAPAMPAFPPNPSQPARRAPATAAAGSSQSHAKSKKKAPNKRRRSKAATSSDEEASSPSEDSNSDSTNSGTSESAPGAGSVTHPLRHKHAKKQRSADSEVQGVMSRQDEEEFYEALTKFWGKQGSGGKRILAKYQPFESMRLTSGMPTFGAHHYWAAVMGIGGHNMATEKKAWAAIGRLFSPPKSMTTLSHTFKLAYEKLLLPFEEATRKGETGIGVPPETGKLPPISAIRARPAHSIGGYGGPTSSGRSQTATDESDSDSDAPRDRQKYLRVMTQSRGRVKDYGETPVKRARLALEGYTWGCPTLPTAADLAGMDDVMVAAEAVMSQQAAALAPGTHVEYRSREPYLIGGWFRAKILKVAAGSAAEGGRCFLLDCTDFDADSARPQLGNHQDWVPLVYPDANGGVPHVMIRLPLHPARPPTADKRWKRGDRVEGFWQNAWWTSTVQDIEADGTVVCLSDATPVYPEGEEWEVERENLRAGHPQEASGFGMMELGSAPAVMHKIAWGEKIKARKFRVDGFSIEAFSCQLHMGPADSAKPEEDARLIATKNPSVSPDRKSPSPRPPSKSPGAGSGSDTTRSASPGGQNPNESAANSENPGADPSRSADPDGRQDLADAITNGPAPAMHDALLPANTDMQQDGVSESNPGIANSSRDCGRRRSPSVQPTPKVKLKAGTAQQAQRANKVRVKSEHAEAEEASQYGQGYWQTAPQHAQHARQPADFSRPYSTAGYAYPSFPPPHAQHLTAADAEAQLFFMPHSSASLPPAAMMAPKPNGFVAHPSAALPLPVRAPASSLQQQHQHAQQQQQQQHFYQQQQQQWQQHQHQQMLMHQRRQQQASMGKSREQQFETLKPGQTLRIVQSQKRMSAPGMDPAQHAQHAMHAAASQPPMFVSQNSNGLPGSGHDSSGSQHAHHGANGASKPSVHSGQPHPRGANGTSTAFIVWCDAQYKARGQLEKRAALRSFVQTAKEETASSQELSKLLIELVGEELIREWQMLYRAGRPQGSDGTVPPMPGSQPMPGCQRASPQPGGVPFLFSSPAGVSNPSHTHAAPIQYSGAPGIYPPSQTQYSADDARVMSSHAQPSAWSSADHMQSQMPTIPPMALNSHGYAMPRHVMVPHALQGNPAKAFMQQPGVLVSHGPARGLSMSHELMQQGSKLMINTSHALHGLTKQDYGVASVSGVQNQSLLPGHDLVYPGPDQKPSQVEIVDVTDSPDDDADDNEKPGSSPTGALPFPAVTLPFEVP